MQKMLDIHWRPLVKQNLPVVVHRSFLSIEGEVSPFLNSKMANKLCSTVELLLLAIAILSPMLQLYRNDPVHTTSVKQFALKNAEHDAFVANFGPLLQQLAAVRLGNQ